MSNGDGDSPEVAKPPTIDERASQLEALLDSYEKSIRLPSFSFAEDEVSKVLTLSREALHAMNAVELGESAFLLSRFALHLQKCHNKEVGTVRWAEESLARITS